MAQRYRLTPQQIFDCCGKDMNWDFVLLYCKVVRILFMTTTLWCRIVSGIKERHPDCAVTLSVGEKDRQSMQAFFDAGADRYPLREGDGG